jgi:hypothetical protein
MTDRTGGTGFVFILDANVTGTRVASWLAGSESFLFQYVAT